MKTNRLLMGAAAAAILTGQAAVSTEALAQDELVHAFGGDIDPFFGDINPFAGDINPFSGDISPFAGDINPFRGDINPFYGDVSPFWGDISPFWGDISPFSGDISPFSGDINPFAGDISPFTGDVHPFWGDINPFSGDITAFSGDITAFSGDIISFNGDSANAGVFWGAAGALWGDLNQNWGQNPAQTQSNLQSFLSLTEQVWGQAVYNATGQSFAAFMDAILAGHGIDRTSASALASVDHVSRSKFFMDFYDSLMGVSGTDILDHWMPTANWTPALTQVQSRDHDSVVGLLDVRISSTDDNVLYLFDAGGYTASPNAHGAAVASLIAGRHDGRGVMGIAPSSFVYAYSPFDNSGTANWQDVQNGVRTLSTIGANVINMSLGYRNFTFHQKTANIFSDPFMQGFTDNTTFVIAAGNEGKTQTQKVTAPAGSKFDNLLIVGSIDPTKTISFFSNRPGEACIEIGNVCSETNKLKYRFLVAPGELILTSDNAGGTTRMSGTSFAAPLVTGAVSLLHDRWPWLQNHASETADIILQSAEDLGAPGVDGTYGWGALDVEASQSPLNFDNLVIYQPNGSGGFSTTSATQFRNTVMLPGQLDLWELQGAKVFAIENIGATHRDFSIPLSSMLWGQDGAFNGNTEQYQRHVYERMVDWAGGASSFATFDETENGVARIGEWGISMIVTPTNPLAPVRQQDRPFASSLLFKTKSGKLSFRVGEGAGAMALTGADGFDHYSDHEPETGGVNPILGFASGGFYSGMATELADGVTLGFGFTEAEDDHSYIDAFSKERLTDLPGLENYRASAVNLDVAYAAADNVTLSVAYTRLDEGTGVLGAQGIGALSLGDGATTDAITIGATYRAMPNLRLSLSATAGETNGGDMPDRVLAVGEDGIRSTAFQFAAESTNVLTGADRLRVTVAQPLHVEAGALRYQSVQVVNRATGELGVVDEYWNLGGERHVYAETQYAFPVLENAAEVSFFGRVDVGQADFRGSYDAASAGARFNLSF
ncbi:MAG: S8 family serine peptidase [Alphaproteobacteria bacterium]|nr:S8 family serine peptidase [Alphaproteobacteria bacterium]